MWSRKRKLCWFLVDANTDTCLTCSAGRCGPGSSPSRPASVTVTVTPPQWARCVDPTESLTFQPASPVAPNQWVDTREGWSANMDHIRLHLFKPQTLQNIPFVFLSEPEQLCVCIQLQRRSRGVTGKVPESRLSAGLPHLSVYYLCVQHDRSHGSDTLRHHPHQVRCQCVHKRELLAFQADEGWITSWIIEEWFVMVPETPRPKGDWYDRTSQVQNIKCYRCL